MLAQMPSAREIHTLKPFDVPVLDNLTLNTMRAPPDRSDDYGDENSSDEETVVDPELGHVVKLWEKVRAATLFIRIIRY